MTQAPTHRSQHPFGATTDGTPVERIELRNARGTLVEILTLGAALRRVEVPDRDGARANVTLCLADVAAYERCDAFLGATVGRYANRIGGARFVLDGVEHALDANDGSNTLHGGARGLHRAVWQVDPPGAHAPTVTLRHLSPDGDQGFPGTLLVTARYALTEDDDLHVTYRATTDRPTVVSLASHAYWNLAGEGAPTVLDHELELAADAFTPVDEGLVPTGEIRSVAGTPFDFRRPRALGEGIDEGDAQLAHGGGYDHNLVLADHDREAPAFAARLRHPGSGRTMELWTTAPGLQLYAGNQLDGSLAGCGGRPYGRRSGVCLEAQRLPDAPNRATFPTAVLRPGETYVSHAIHRFRVS